MGDGAHVAVWRRPPSRWQRLARRPCAAPRCNRPSRTGLLSLHLPQKHNGKAGKHSCLEATSLPRVTLGRLTSSRSRDNQKHNSGKSEVLFQCSSDKGSPAFLTWSKSPEKDAKEEV